MRLYFSTLAGGKGGLDPSVEFSTLFSSLNPSLINSQDKKIVILFVNLPVSAQKQNEVTVILCFDSIGNSPGVVIVSIGTLRETVSVAVGDDGLVVSTKVFGRRRRRLFYVRLQPRVVLKSMFKLYGKKQTQNIM